MKIDSVITLKQPSLVGIIAQLNLLKFHHKKLVEKHHHSQAVIRSLQHQIKATAKKLNYLADHNYSKM